MCLISHLYYIWPEVCVGLNTGQTLRQDSSAHASFLLCVVEHKGAEPLIWMHSHAHKNMFMSVYVSSLAFTQAEMQVRYIHLFI